MKKATFVAVIGEVDDPIPLPSLRTILMYDFDGNGLYSCAVEMLYVIGVDGESDLLVSKTNITLDKLPRSNGIAD